MDLEELPHQISRDHQHTIDRLTRSASLLAGICRFQQEEGQAPELERGQLINQTILLTQQALHNSLRLEPRAIQTFQPIIQPTPEQLELTPLEDLTLHQQDHQLDHHLIYSQLQIKQKFLNQWIRLILDYNPEENSESESEDHPSASQSAAVEDQIGDQEDYGLDQESDEFDLFPDDLETSSSEGSQDQPNLSYTTTLLNQGEEPRDNSDSSSTSPSSSPEQAPKNKKFKSSNPKLNSSSSCLIQDAFFNLAEFEAEVNQGESQMKKKLRRFKSQLKQDSDEDDNDDDREELDLFAPYGTGCMDDENDDNDGQEDQSMFNLDSVPDVRYDDFFGPIKVKNQKSIKSKAGKREKPTSKKEPKERFEREDKPKKDKDESKQLSDPKSHSSKGSRVKFSEQVAVQEIPAKNRGMRVSELFGNTGDDESDGSEIDEQSFSSMLTQLETDEDDDEDMEEGDPTERWDKTMSGMDEHDLESMEEDEEPEERDQKTMSRLDSELFDDGFSSDGGGDGADSNTDDQDEESDEKISRHARKMKTLSKEIARLEAENVAKKDWMLKGEASSKDRPQNSLLEQDLEFEHVQKIAPAVTEEKTMNLESLIKQRILEANYDDVVRKRLVDPKAFLPSRLLELSDAQATQSLTEIYEESYKDKQKESETGVRPTDIRDEKLEKEHKEIKEMFESLSNKLDGLSNAHFTPPEPKIKIKTINDLPTVSIESTLPTATGTGTLLAPEELFNVKSSKDIAKDMDSLTHSQKQNMRTQHKKSKNKLNSTRIIKPNDKDIGLKKLSTKEQKQVSLDHLTKLSSSLNSNLTSNTSLTLLNKRGAKLNTNLAASGHPKQRKLVDGSAFKL